MHSLLGQGREEEEVYFDVDPLAPRRQPARSASLNSTTHRLPSAFASQADLVESPTPHQQQTSGNSSRIHYYDVSGAVRGNSPSSSSSKARQTGNGGVFDGSEIGARVLAALPQQGQQPRQQQQPHRHEGGATRDPALPSLAMLQRDVLLRDQAIAQAEAKNAVLQLELDAYKHMLLDDGCLAAYRHMLLQQHRGLVSVAAKLVRSACEGMRHPHADTARAESEAQRRDAHFHEELAFLVAEKSRDHQREVNALRKELQHTQTALATAQSRVEKVTEENVHLQAQLRAVQPSASHGNNHTTRMRSPLRTRRFQSDAALAKRLRTSAAICDDGAAGTIIAMDTDADDSESIRREASHDSRLRWKIEALALAKEHDRLVESWVAAEATSASLRAHQQSQTAEMAVLRSELQRLRELLRQSVDGVYERVLLADKAGRQPQPRTAALDPDGDDSPPEVASTPSAHRATSRPDGGDHSSALEALAATSASLSIGEDDASARAAAPPFLTRDDHTVVGDGWRQFQLDLVHRLQEEQELLLSAMEVAAHGLAARACHVPLPDVSPLPERHATPVTTAHPTLLDWRRCRQSLLTSAEFYAAVAAQAQATLTHFQRKLDILDDNAKGGEWNVRVAKKVLGTDHKAALESLVTCLNELVVPRKH